jgi:Leucine-rich repeat (LRR) protein
LFVSDLNNHVQRPPSNESILQRFVLVLLYAMTNGNFWNSNNLWLDGTVSECLWENVICSEGSGNILELKLQDNNLQGELPSEISMLLSLRHLWLDTNPRLGGTLPSELAGIPSMELSGISTLKTLSISGTSIGGTIPSEFGTLERLTDFLASQTRLEGTLPTELGLLDRLRELDVSFNRLNGTLPISFSSMVNVETLDFSFNSLTGSLPRSWSSLSFLETLDVSHNFLSGFLPEPYGELLAFIDFGGNPDFEGGVPSAYCGLVFLDYLIVDCDSVSIDSESCPCCQCG